MPIDQSKLAFVSGHKNNCALNVVLLQILDLLDKQPLPKVFETEPYQKLLRYFNIEYGTELSWLEVKQLLEQYPNPLDREIIFSQPMRSCISPAFIPAANSKKYLVQQFYQIADIIFDSEHADKKAQTFAEYLKTEPEIYDFFMANVKEFMNLHAEVNNSEATRQKYKDELLHKVQYGESELDSIIQSCCKNYVDVLSREEPMFMVSTHIAGWIANYFGFAWHSHLEKQFDSFYYENDAWYLTQSGNTDAQVGDSIYIPSLQQTSVVTGKSGQVLVEVDGKEQLIDKPEGKALKVGEEFTENDQKYTIKKVVFKLSLDPEVPVKTSTKGFKVYGIVEQHDLKGGTISALSVSDHWYLQTDSLEKAGIHAAKLTLPRKLAGKQTKDIVPEIQQQVAKFANPLAITSKPSMLTSYKPEKDGMVTTTLHADLTLSELGDKLTKTGAKLEKQGNKLIIDVIEGEGGSSVGNIEIIEPTSNNFLLTANKSQQPAVVKQLAVTLIEIGDPKPIIDRGNADDLLNLLQTLVGTNIKPILTSELRSKIEVQLQHAKFDARARELIQNSYPRNNKAPEP